MVPCYFTICLFCAVLASHTPWSAQTHHPPVAPVSPRLLLCGSLSHSLPPILSCSLSCAPLSLSLLSDAPLSSFPTASYSLSLSLSLSLKGGFGLFGVSLSSPGFEPSSTGQKRCGVSTGPRRLGICTTCSYLSFLPPPVCHPLSCVSSFAWGCAEQRVEEPHSVPGYRVRLPEERSLEQPQEVRSACQPHMHAISSSTHRGGHRSVSLCRRTVEDRLPLERVPLACTFGSPLDLHVRQSLGLQGPIDLDHHRVELLIAHQQWFPMVVHNLAVHPCVVWLVPSEPDVLIAGPSPRGGGGGAASSAPLGSRDECNAGNLHRVGNQRGSTPLGA